MKFTYSWNTILWASVVISPEAIPAPLRQACDNIVDLGGITYHGDNRHSAATSGAGPGVDFVYLGKQAGPGATPLRLANLAILEQVPKAGILTGDTAIPAQKIPTPMGDVQGQPSDEVHTGEMHRLALKVYRRG